MHHQSWSMSGSSNMHTCTQGKDKKMFPATGFERVSLATS